jgi:hypothetical protein
VIHDLQRFIDALPARSAAGAPAALAADEGALPRAG